MYDEKNDGLYDEELNLVRDDDKYQLFIKKWLPSVNKSKSKRKNKHEYADRRHFRKPPQAST